MNAAQRKILAAMKATIREFHGKIEDLASELDTAKDDEQDKFDNMTEGLQASANGQQIEQAASDLGEAHSSLESALNELESAADKINDVISA